MEVGWARRTGFVVLLLGLAKNLVGHSGAQEVQMLGVQLKLRVRAEGEGRKADKAGGRARGRYR